MRVARIIEKTAAEGPGFRFTIWLQGCPHHCEGCYAKSMWPFDGGTDISTEELYDRIMAAADEIEGLTFLGGEPLSQAQELYELLKKIRSAPCQDERPEDHEKKSGLSVTVFTGFVYEDIEAYGSSFQKEVLKMTDLLIDGPYEEKNRDFSRPLVGSKNQRFLFLTDRYSIKDIEEMSNRIEVRIDRDGVVKINGMGDFPELTSLLQDRGMINGGYDPVGETLRDFSQGSRKKRGIRR